MEAANSLEIEDDWENLKGPGLSLIITVYSRPDYVEKILCSLETQSFTDFEVLVADDGSGPEGREVVDSFRRRSPQPVKHVWHEDEGFRRARISNRAALKARAPYLVFIDGDCVLHPRFLERHFRRRQKQVVLVGRRVKLNPEISSRLSLEDIRQRRLTRLSFWLNHCEPNSRKHGLYCPFFDTVKNILFSSFHLRGCNFSIHRGDFLAVNGYDESIVGWGLEDDNLEARLLLARNRIRTVSSEAIQYHLAHPSRPFRHATDAVERLKNPPGAWAENGVRKGKQDSST